MKKLIALLLILLLLTGCTSSKPVEPTTEPTEPSVAEPGLTVHFLDVQHADSILLACGGEYALVDGGYPESGERIVSYMRQQESRNWTCWWEHTPTATISAVCLRC